MLRASSIFEIDDARSILLAEREALELWVYRNTLVYTKHCKTEIFMFC